LSALLVSCFLHVWIVIKNLFTHIGIAIQGNTFYLFYETKNSITNQGDIGVSKSTDKGATWQQLGIALNEDWHLSYPYVFEHEGQVLLVKKIMFMFCYEHNAYDLSKALLLLKPIIVVNCSHDIHFFACL